MHITSSPPTFGSSLCLEAVTHPRHPAQGVLVLNILLAQSPTSWRWTNTLCLTSPTSFSVLYHCFPHLPSWQYQRQLISSWNLPRPVLSLYLKGKESSEKRNESIQALKQPMDRLKRPLLTIVSLLREKRNGFLRIPGWMHDGLQEGTTGDVIFWIIVYKHTGETAKTE